MHVAVNSKQIIFFYYIVIDIIAAISSVAAPLNGTSIPGPDQPEFNGSPAGSDYQYITKVARVYLSVISLRSGPHQRF